MNIRLLYFFLFLSGFAAIGLEVLWTRILVMVIGGSVYAFAIVLVAFLAGIALGSLIISPFIGRLRNALIWFAVFEILIGVLVIISIPLLGNLPFWFLDIYKLSGGSFAGLQFGLWILAGAVMFAPTLLMGGAFPLALISADQNAEKRGSAIVGKIYALNTIGGVLGSLAAGFLLIPMIGVQKGILGMGIVYLITGAAVLLHFYSSSDQAKPGSREVNNLTMKQFNNGRSRPFDSLRARTIISISVFLVTLIIILIGLQFESFDKSILSAGFYKDPTLYIGKDKEILKRQLKKSKVLFDKEGVSSHVAVTQGPDGVLSLRINGKADASTGEDMENQLLLGHLPMLLHPSTGSGPKEVLVVGMGSGITLGSILSHNPKHVDAIEIEEKVVEAARYFNDYSNNALSHHPSCHPGGIRQLTETDRISSGDSIGSSSLQNDKGCLTAVADPRVNIIVGDGRNYLSSLRHSGKPVSRRAHPESLTAVGDAGQASMTSLYDVITSEPSNPWLSGSSKLFTKEYFELLKKGIKEDGVVLQWINLYALDMEGLKRVIAAFDEVFPHAAAFGMPASNDLALLGANKPLAFDIRHSGKEVPDGTSASRISLEGITAVRDSGVASLPRMTQGGFDATVSRDFAKVGIKEPFEILAYFVMGDKELKKLVGNTPANSDNYPYVEFAAPKYLYQPVSVNPWRVIFENLSPIESVVYSSSDPAQRGSREVLSNDRSRPFDSLRARTIKNADEFRRARLLTQIYSIEKNIGEGIKEGEKALKIDPDNIFIKETLAQFYFEEGTSFFNQSIYGKAINSLSKSLSLKQTSEAYFNLGQTYGWDENLEKALENYEFAVKLDPEFEQAWMWLGDTASQLGDLNGAISSYQKAVGLNPKNVEAHIALGNLYILRRDFGRAKKYLDKALELDPSNEKAKELMKAI